MLDKTGRYEFLAEPFHCDFSRRLFLGHLANHLLNAADFHSSDRGFGMTYLNPIHKTWVLSRLAVEMDHMPLQYAKFCVETWIEGAMRYFTNRNFRIVDSVDDSKVYGYGRSIWAMIDTETRQPHNILDIRDGEIEKYIDADKSCPIDKLSRVQMSGKAEFVNSLNTSYGDVDVNGHINSVRYMEHVLDMFSLEYYRKYRIRRFDIAYVSESYYGDKLSFYRETTSENEFCVRIARTAPQTNGEMEVCRCKVKFVKD